MLAAGCGENRFQQELKIEESAVKLATEARQSDYDMIVTAELKQLLDSGVPFLLIDAMPAADSFNKSHIPGAQNFLFPKEVLPTDSWDEQAMGGKTQEDFAKFLGEDKERLIVVYCGYVKCARSHNAAAWARQLGHSNVKRYAGGIYAWKGAGLPTESGG
jgi:rhodanese-related sulfurtransferase